MRGVRPMAYSYSMGTGEKTGGVSDSGFTIDARTLELFVMVCQAAKVGQGWQGRAL